MASKNLRFNPAFLAFALAAMSLGACTKKNAEVSDLKVNSVQLLNVKTENTRYGVKKTLKYQACLSQNESSAKNQDIVINDGFESRDGRTDENGCVQWNEQHQMNAELSSTFKSEPVVITRTFSSTRSGLNASNPASTTIGMAIDPTIEVPREIAISINDGYTATPLSFDSEAQINNRTRKTGKAWAPWISLSFQGHAKKQTSVNRLLTLKPAQKFMLRMDPRLMMTGANRNVTLDAVNFGEFKLTILTFTEASFESQKFTADNLVAEYSGRLKTRYDGGVIEDIVLRIHDVAGILSRTTAVVVLEPLGDAAKKANVGIFYSPVAPLRANSVHLELRDFEDAPDDLLARLEVARQRANKSLSGVQMLQAAGFQHLNLPDAFIKNRLAGKPFSADESKLMSQICAKLAPASETLEPTELIPRLMGKKVSAKSECAKQWSRIFRPEVRDFVENVRGVTYLPELANTRYLNLMRDVNHLLVSRREINQNVNVGIYGEFGVNAGTKLGPVGFSGGAKVSTGTNLNMLRIRAKEQITNLQVHEGQHFQVYIDVYQLDLELRRCFIIQPNLDNQRGAYACAETKHRKKVQEKFYLVNHGREGSPFTDNDSPETTEWRLVVRGEESYTNFEKMMTADNVMFDMIKFVLSFSSADLKRPLLPDMRVTQEFPGSLKITQK